MEGSVDPGQAQKEAAAPDEWRAYLDDESRKLRVTTIVDSIQRNVSNATSINKIKNYAEQLEDKIYASSTSKDDYMMTVATTMLKLEKKSLKIAAAAAGSTNSSSSALDTERQSSGDPANSMRSQVYNQGPQIPISIANQPQQQGLVPVNHQSNICSAPVQGFEGLTKLTQSAMSGAGQKSSMQATSCVSQLQTQNDQQKQQLLKQNLQLSSFLHNQKKQHLMQPNQLHSYHKPIIQVSTGHQSSQSAEQHHSVSQTFLQQKHQCLVNQVPSSFHQQDIRQQQLLQQSMFEQGSSILQQPASIIKHPAVLPSHQHQLLGNHQNVPDTQQSLLYQPQNNVLDMQQKHQQQHNQCLPSQHNNIMRMQEPQRALNQQRVSLHQSQHLVSQNHISDGQNNQNKHLAQQSSISISEQHQLDPTNNSSIDQHLNSLYQQQQRQKNQQPQLLGSQSSASLMQQHQLSVPMLHDSRVSGQVLSRPSFCLNGQQQSHSSQQKPSAQIQNHSTPLQQQIEMQGSIASTAQMGSTGADWQDEIFQKIISMRKSCLPLLHGIYRAFNSKLQQHDAPTGPTKKSLDLEVLQKYKLLLEQMMNTLRMPKSNIQPDFKEKWPIIQKQIISLLQKFRRSGGHSILPSTNSTQSKDVQVLNAQPNIPSSMQRCTTTKFSEGNAYGSIHNGGSGCLQSGSLGSVQLSATPVGATPQNNISNLEQNTVNIQSNMVKIPAHTKQAQQTKLEQEHQQEQHLLQEKHTDYQLQHCEPQQNEEILKAPQQLHHQRKQLPQCGQLCERQMQHLHEMVDSDELKRRPISSSKIGLVVRSNHPSGQQQAYYHQQQNLVVSSPFSSELQMSSPQSSQSLSHLGDHQTGLLYLHKERKPIVSVNSPSTASSLAVSSPTSPPVDNAEQLSRISYVSSDRLVRTKRPIQAQSLSGCVPENSLPLIFTTSDENPTNELPRNSIGGARKEQPLHRLLKAVQSLSPMTLRSSIKDIFSVVCVVDRTAGSAPGNGSRAAVGEDLTSMTKWPPQTTDFISQEHSTTIMRVKRKFSLMPLEHNFDNSKSESAAAFRTKKFKTEAKHDLVEEIRVINMKLIDTKVEITDEDINFGAAAESEGLIVKCTYTAITPGSKLKLQFESIKTVMLSPILDFRLIIPGNYPTCSPVPLDGVPMEPRNTRFSEDLSNEAKSRFCKSLLAISRPLSLGEMVKMWDVYARAVISEHAQQMGGGSLSSRYGTWENWISA